MFNNIESYLNDLKAALQGADPALIQDALWDAETHLKNSLATFREKHAEMSESSALAAVIQSYGTPEEVAEAYLERDAVVQKALRPDTAPSDASNAPLAPWPGFFQVLWTPKAYTSLLYLLTALPVGIFFFTWAVTGLSLSAGLIFLVIGIPFAIAFLGSVRILALVEGRLVEALLDVRMPRRPSLLPEGKGVLEKLKNLITDGHTWTSLFYLILHLPLGIFFFTAMVTGISVSLALIGAPIAHWVFGLPVFTWGDSFETGPEWLIAISPVIGFAFLLATMHFALLLGRAQGLLAKHMLVRR
jgi:uncharacterized membrane protein